METPIEWWGQERFHGRVNQIIVNGKVEKSIPIPDREVVCDLCNDEIKDFPCAVTMGYALCKRCQENVMHIQPGDNQFFETDAYSQGLEPKKPRVNVGGRRVEDPK